MTYQLFVDSDGVFADFELLLFQRYNLRVMSCSDEEMWAAINHYEANHGEWFFDLPLMPDALELWNYVKPYTPQILTATGRAYETAAPQKVRWYGETPFHLPPERVITVRKSEMKAAYAHPNAILIDDNFTRSITSWTNAGGIGILHSNARLTIAELKHYGM